MCIPVQRVGGWRRSHQGHCHCDTPRDGPEDEAEVEIVDLTHDVMPPLGGLLRDVVTTGGHRGGELKPEPDQAYHQAHHQSPEGARLVSSESEVK